MSDLPDDAPRAILHDDVRSSAACRVRLAPNPQGFVPTLERIDAAPTALPEVAAAHPDRQPQ